MNKDLTNNKLINDAIKEFLIIKTDNCAFFGEFALRLNYYEVDNKSHIDTCAVNVDHRGFNLYYNSQFINTLNVKQVKFVLLHEIFHLLWNHTKRTTMGNYNHVMANIAQDMIINTTIVNTLMQLVEEYNINPRIEIPTNDKDENIGVFLTNEFLDENDEDKEYFEYVYYWLEKKKKEKKDLPTTNQQGTEVGEKASPSKSNESKESSNEEGHIGSEYGPNSKDRNGNPINCNSLDSILKQSDYKGFDVHIPNEISDEIKDVMVKEITKEIENTLKNRGDYSGNNEHLLKKLIRKKKDHLREIKSGLSNIFSSSGTKIKTIVKPNRRDIWGLKGKRKAKPYLNVILDTSHSMKNEFEKVLSYIFRNDISVNLIQCDTKVKETKNVSNMKDLQRLEIKGLGGTVLMPAIKHIEENKLDKYNTVILTDGYTDTLDLSKLRCKVMIISTSKKCNISKKSVRGVKQIIIDK